MKRNSYRGEIDLLFPGLRVNMSRIYILLQSVKKLFTYLLCMLAVIIIIAHDSIHHHHNSLESIEVVNSHGQDENDHHDEDHFPPHQHIVADTDFFTARNLIPGGKVLNHIHIELSLLVNFFPENNSNLYFTGFIVSEDPPFLKVNTLIPNITRGSPALS